MADRKADGPKLLSGGNPQIPKGDGQDPIDAYIAAMPGWKSAVGRQIDQTVSSVVPGVIKAVRWNSPFYGCTGKGWFLTFHCLTRYIKLTFFNGSQLVPLPPIAAKDANARYFHIREGDELAESAFRKWVEQSSRLPGWILDNGP